MGKESNTTSGRQRLVCVDLTPPTDDVGRFLFVSERKEEESIREAGRVVAARECI